MFRVEGFRHRGAPNDGGKVLGHDRIDHPKFCPRNTLPTTLYLQHSSQNHLPEIVFPNPCTFNPTTVSIIQCSLGAMLIQERALRPLATWIMTEDAQGILGRCPSRRCSRDTGQVSPNLLLPWKSDTIKSLQLSSTSATLLALEPRGFQGRIIGVHTPMVVMYSIDSRTTTLQKYQAIPRSARF